MTKKRKSVKKSGQKPGLAAKRKLHWGRIAKRGLLVSAMLAIFAVAVAAYSHNKQQEYDLTVIGNGTPTVVQVHDPNCQFCRRLKSNLNSVQADFMPEVQFKTANIASAKGRKFASQHNVPHVTLLFFNKRGKRVHIQQGVTAPDKIRTLLQSLVQGRRITKTG